MIVEERAGDLFSYDGPVIGHGVNTAGVMGAGIAKEFKRRWPEMFKEYQHLCENGRLNPGEIFPYEVGPGNLVLNLATQDKPGKRARWNWISSAIQEAATVVPKIFAECQEFAIPRIGCGIGGLQWENVKQVIRSTTPPYDFTVVVYSLEGE